MHILTGRSPKLLLSLVQKIFSSIVFAKRKYHNDYYVDFSAWNVNILKPKFNRKLFLFSTEPCCAHEGTFSYSGPFMKLKTIFA